MPIEEDSDRSKKPKDYLPVKTDAADKDSQKKRQEGDLSTYKYYFSSLGWLSLAVFVLFVTSNTAFGAVQCKGHLNCSHSVFILHSCACSYSSTDRD